MTSFPIVPRKKETLRQVFKKCRQALPRAQRRAAEESIAQRFCSHIPLPKNARIAGYWPAGSETDCRLLLERLRRERHNLALPVIEKDRNMLRFRIFDGEAFLVKNTRYGFMEPPQEAEEVMPDVILVPLVAFDRRGERIGQGGGFYDRTLASLRRKGNVLAIGIAYACQECDAVPREAHDQQLDWVVTEKEVLGFRNQEL